IPEPVYDRRKGRRRKRAVVSLRPDLYHFWYAPARIIQPPDYRFAWAMRCGHLPATVPSAIPPMINVIARNSEGSSGSFSIAVALMIPRSGVARRHSDVVTAGRLRFTIVIAQLANAVQTIPP